MAKNTNTENKLSGTKKHMDLGDHLEYIESLLGGGGGSENVDDVTVNGTSVVEDKVANIKLKTINNESIVGEGNIKIEGGGISVPTFDAQFEDPTRPEFEDFQLTQEDLNDIWENKYPLIKIRVTIEDEGQTTNYIICFKLSYNVDGMAMTYAIASMEFSDDADHQYDLDCMSFIIALDEDTNLPIIAAVKEEYYTNDYRKLENKPNIPEIVTTIGPDSLDDTVPSSKCVYDAISESSGSITVKEINEVDINPELLQEVYNEVPEILRINSTNDGIQDYELKINDKNNNFISYTCIIGGIEIELKFENKEGTIHYSTDILNFMPSKFVDNLYTAQETDSLLNNKQDTLVSGTNIKTINGESILGHGNITTPGGSGDSSNPWKDKVISIMGDSISTFSGWIPMSDGHNLDHVTYYPTSGFNDVTKTWWHKLINDLGAKLGVNESWSGSYVGNTLNEDVSSGVGNKYGKKACMAGNTRIENLGANGTPDLILVYGGTNDLWSGNSKFGETVPGTFDSTQNYDVSSTLLNTNTWSSFAEAYRDMIRKMMYYYPQSRIVVLFPFYADSTAAYSNAQLDAFIEVQREICDYFGINYIDLRACGINAGNIKASANKKGFTTILVGNVHPNEAGMTLMKDYIKAKLLSFFDTDRQSTTVYTVTNNLTVNTNSDRYIKGVSAGESYQAKITGSNLGLVKVYMGETDVTSTVYNSSTGIINIASVTGNINIAEAELQSYTITTSVTNGSYTGASTIMSGNTATVTISPATDYALPVSVTVTGATHSYDSSTGVITLSNPTANVTISATCVALTTYTITTSVTNGSYSGDASIVQGRTASVTIAPDSSYMLPSSVTVTNATYSYDSTTGVISLSAPTGNVTITATCPIIPVSYSITTSVTNGIHSGATSIYDGQTAQVIIAANINYALPSSITVSGADYTYDSITGEIDLSNPTDNVTISAECGERGWFSSNYNANPEKQTSMAQAQYAGFSYKEGVYDGDGIKMNAVRFKLARAGTITVGKVASDFKSVTASETLTVSGNVGDLVQLDLTNTYTLENGEHFFISRQDDTAAFYYCNRPAAAPNGQKNFYIYSGYSNVDAGNRPDEVLSVDFGYFIS